MSWKHLFTDFLGAAPGRLHLAAHSHHPWPDVTRAAHQQAWDDAAALMDDKWEKVFGEVVPEARRRLAGMLRLPDPQTLAFAPNTHELVGRLFSCLPPPVRIVTTDAEFHSFNRQARRWAEAGVAQVDVVAAEPFATFHDRFTAALAGADLVYLSQVFFDSGFVVPHLEEVAAAAPPRALVVIDGYHGFMAVPTDLSLLGERGFYLSGGYKYAMAGEGACFMHCPPEFAGRPVDTGWFAGFAGLTDRSLKIVYGEGGDRFWGGTFDPTGLYRLVAVLRMVEEEQLTPALIHDHVRGLQGELAAGLEGGELGELVPSPGFPRGNFLTYRHPAAGSFYRALHERGVITDYRGDRLRIGLGIYHDHADVERFLEVVRTLPAG
jgi:kynureninase